MRGVLRPRYFFFFNDTATTEIYTLSLHDALPICHPAGLDRHAPGLRRADHDRAIPGRRPGGRHPAAGQGHPRRHERLDRKSTRLNSSHANISYAVFCLKKKKFISAIKIDKGTAPT